MAPGGIFWSAVVFALACGVYHNSLPNDFAFDGWDKNTCSYYITVYSQIDTDHLAIVNNGDTDPESPWADIWRNDIWGKVQ